MRYYVGRQEEIAERSGRVVDAGGVSVGVFRVKGRLYAYRNRCLHQGGPVCTGVVLGKVETVLAADRTSLGDRFSDDEIHVVCPWHGWEYDLETGRHAADRSLELRAFPVVVDGDAVYVEVDTGR